MKEIVNTLEKHTNFFNRLNGEIKHIKNPLIKELFSPQERFYERTVDEKKFVIDKNSTSINSTWFALSKCYTPLILVAGGIDKNQNYSILDEHLHKIQFFINISKKNYKIEEYMNKNKIPQESIPNIKESLHYAKDIAIPKYTILVSPGHPSFDLFENNEDRTQKFIDALWEL